MKELLSLCPEKLHCPVPLQTLVFRHLNGIFLTSNFSWAFSRTFVNSGRKDRAKFSNFDPCTVCGKTSPVSGGIYLPAFWATPLSTVIPAFWATPNLLRITLILLEIGNTITIVFQILCCSMALPFELLAVPPRYPPTPFIP